MPAKLQIGVSFRDLHCHGFTTTTRKQKTFVGSLLALPKMIGSIFGVSQKRRVQILRDFEGLILPGEMLLVLGRPGSGCSTFLKALSGDTPGFYIGDESNLNYQGRFGKPELHCLTFPHSSGGKSV